MGNQEIKILPMTPADLDGVMEVERLSFLTPWSREAFDAELMQTYTVYLIAREGERVIAYGGIHVAWEDAHVTNVAVHPRYRGLGLGEKMMRELMARATVRGAHRITLEVRRSNAAAQNLYRKLGYITEPGAVRKGYYSDTLEDAIVMWKDPIIDPEVSQAAEV